MAIEVNEVLRRALYSANLTAQDLAAKLLVDPKTADRWVRGNLPHPHSRAALTQLLGVDEEVLWPELRKLAESRRSSAEIAGIYPRRTTIGQKGWLRFFESAESEIGILAYSALFLAEDARIVGMLRAKSRTVRVRIALGAPDSASVIERGAEEDIGEAMPAKIRNSLALLEPLLREEGVELRLHDTVLYNSIYRSDGDLLVNQHAYGIPAAQSPVYHYRQSAQSEMFDSYAASFEAVWAKSEVRPVR
ncbi:XRE family transcriptional regulator [Kribbella solani]|uniref:XRE family transcriptional regulator n=1 Tax=Kribbella solani TaxID=236067 RepID=UPI0029AB98D8|nr:XRE family transcriptional regulator [Kribbella solani]MDX3006542.1 XRE family transcriptional regulator [Kribbella solani]